MPALACSGGAIPLEDYVHHSDAIAIIHTTTVGNAENPQPAVEPNPNFTHVPGVTPAPLSFDLTGYGAYVTVQQTVLGNPPASFELDSAVRTALEKDLRQREAGNIAPCDPGFLLPRYGAAETYLAFLVLKNGQWETFGRMFIQGTEAEVDGRLAELPDGREPVDGGPQLIVTQTDRDLYFADLPSVDYGSFAPAYNNEEAWRIDVTRVPLDQLITAIEGIATQPVLPTATPFISTSTPKAAAAATATETATETPALDVSNRITPPGTGDAGLR